MIKGIGIDIIEVARIKGMMEKYGDKFFKRILTENEINYCKSFPNSLNFTLPEGLPQRKHTVNQLEQVFPGILVGKI